MEKPIQMMPKSPRVNSPRDDSARISVSVFSTLFLCAALLAGCASKPGMPGDPVLGSTSTSDNKPIPSLIPIGPLKSITPGQVGGLKIAHAEPPKELWDRIRRGFAMPDLQSNLVTDREQ